MEQLLSSLDIVGIIGWAIALIGVPFVTALWGVVRKGRKVLSVREGSLQNGKWTAQEKDDYIKASIEFWDELGNLWKVTLKGIKGWFKKG